MARPAVYQQHVEANGFNCTGSNPLILGGGAGGGERQRQKQREKN